MALTRDPTLAAVKFAISADCPCIAPDNIVPEARGAPKVVLGRWVASAKTEVDGSL